MVHKWILLTELGGDRWILPIWTAMDKAAREGKIPQRGHELNELGMHISTRLNFLPRIVARVNTATADLFKLVDDRRPEHECSQHTEGVGLDVDNDMKYELLIDLDSLLFELNAVCTPMKILFRKLHNHAGKTMTDEQAGHEIRALLKRSGQDPCWFKKLDSHRNFFMHQAAPYIAVDISNIPYDLLIMKENLNKFCDQNKFTTLSEIDYIVQGFRRSREIMRHHLINLFP